MKFSYFLWRKSFNLKFKFNRITVLQISFLGLLFASYTYCHCEWSSSYFLSWVVVVVFFFFPKPTAVKIFLSNLMLEVSWHLPTYESIPWVHCFHCFNMSWWLELFPRSSVSKEAVCSAGDLGSIPGSARSLGEENGNPLQYSSLGNPMDRGAWPATAHGVTRVRHNLANKPLQWLE